MDYQGGTPTGGGFGGGNTNSEGRAPRRSYDEQTLIPVTIRMALASHPDSEGTLQLEDGRKLFHIRLVAAVRSVEDFSTNVLYNVEDGTGLIEVKQWLDDKDCTATVEMRQATLKEHIYVKIIGQVKDYDGKKMILADSVRPLTTGNELTHHMLEVVFSGENVKRKDTFVAPQLTATGAPLQATVNDGLREAVVTFIRDQGHHSDVGASVQECVKRFVGTFAESEIRKMIADLSAEGHIYSTADEDHYQFAG